MSSLPIEVFTSDQVKLIEEDHARANNGHCFDLMQKAGLSVFNFIVKECPQSSSVWIFCGKGNNGGDGYILASLLLDNHIEHRVFATGLPHEDTEASLAYQYYLQIGGVVESELPQINSYSHFERPQIVVDALLGTGLSSSPEGITQKWISYIRKLRTYTVSVDVPSGVNADTGNVPGACVKADATVCMLALKPGLITGDAVDYVGKIIFAPLGVNSQEYFDYLNQHSSRYNLPIVQCDYDDIKVNLPKRKPSFNKSDSGKVLIIAGAKGMGGAAIICGMGALRSGAGLVKVAIDNTNVSAMLSVCPELMSVDLHNDDELKKAIEWADVIAVGPGLGRNEKTAHILGLLENLDDKYLVYDADALNVLSVLDGVHFNQNRIITPHPGEAARLLNTTVDEICQDRFKAAYLLQQKYGGTVLLKGAGTVICDGETYTVINDGSPALATGGSGDLLTGIISSMFAQGISIDMSAIVGACIHARAGVLAGCDGGVIGTLPLDLCKYIRELINAKN